MNGWDDFVSFIRALSYLLIIGTFAEKHYFIFIIICTYEHIYLHITILINVLFLLAHRYYIETEKGELDHSYTNTHTCINAHFLYSYAFYICTHMYIYTHMYIFYILHLHTYVYIYIYIYPCLSTYRHTYINASPIHIALSVFIWL